jgi:hypothetical protein
VIETITRLELSGPSVTRADGDGRAAYEPSMCMPVRPVSAPRRHRASLLSRRSVRAAPPVTTCVITQRLPVFDRRHDSLLTRESGAGTGLPRYAGELRRAMQTVAQAIRCPFRHAAALPRRRGRSPARRKQRRARSLAAVVGASSNAERKAPAERAPRDPFRMNASAPPQVTRLPRWPKRVADRRLDARMLVARVSATRQARDARTDARRPSARRLRPTAAFPSGCATDRQLHRR